MANISQVRGLMLLDPVTSPGARIPLVFSSVPMQALTSVAGVTLSNASVTEKEIFQQTCKYEGYK